MSQEQIERVFCVLCPDITAGLLLVKDEHINMILILFLFFHGKDFLLGPLGCNICCCLLLSVCNNQRKCLFLSTDSNVYTKYPSPILLFVYLSVAKKGGTAAQRGSNYG